MSSGANQPEPAHDPAADALTGIPTGKVVLSVPQEPRAATVARTMVCACASHAALTLDQVDDLALAVSEMVALLLRSPEGGGIDVEAEPHRGGIEVTGRTHGGVDQLPGRESFAWTVLSTLVDEVTATAEGGEISITMRVDAVAPQQPTPGEEAEASGAGR